MRAQSRNLREKLLLKFQKEDELIHEIQNLLIEVANLKRQGKKFTENNKTLNLKKKKLLVENEQWKVVSGADGNNSVDTENSRSL